MPLLDDSTLRNLDRLTLASRRIRAGTVKGERRSKQHGTSIEFADYRDYVHGDDLRRVDWNIYARLDRPYLKLLEEEEELAVHVLVDASGSMNWGEGEKRKFTYAVRLTAALGYIALASGDRLTVSLIRSANGSRPAQFGPHRGRGHALPLLRFLEAQVPSGQTDLNARLRNYANAARRPGLAYLISDLLSPSGFEEGLSHLQGRGYQLGVLHVLCPEELDPPLSGDLRLVDVETGQGQDVTLDGGMRDLYQRRVRERRDGIEAFCAKRSMHYLRVETSVPLEELVLEEMRRKGLVR